MVERIESAEINGKIVKLANNFIRIKTRDGEIKISENEAEKLCVELEKALYDEPTYDELADKNSDLEYQVEDLKSEVEYLREQLEDIRYRRFG